MKQHASVKGFTLIELLVVIAIIAILAGILLPTVIGAFKKASDAQAYSEVKSIETAMKQYYNEYGKFPKNSGDSPDKTYGKIASVYNGDEDNHEVIRILRAIDGQGNSGHVNNKRRIVFIEINEKSLDSDGNFLDPWDSQYIIGADTDFNNEVKLKSVPGLDLVKSRNVAVLSFGANKQTGPAFTNKYITSWR